MSEEASPDREPINRVVDAVVVGGGFGGLYMLHKLRELGLTLQGFEAGGDVGGTWYWNRYPGARCDIPSLAYSYTWSEALRRDWRWSEKYAAQPEILRYAGHVADRFDLRGLIAFGTRVTSIHFDDQAGVWAIETDRGDRVTARWCVMATGCLSVPQKPEFPGENSFRGPIHHTGRWPHDEVDFAGMSVGVIGTGSSGIQSIPRIADQAAQVTVFQRTPNFSIPARNGPLSDRAFAAFEAGYAEYLAAIRSGAPNAVTGAVEAPMATPEEQRARYEEMWRAGGAGFLGAFPNLLTNIDVNNEAADFVRGKIVETVRDPEVAAALCPRDHPLGTKRICVDVDYYETFNRPNVRLVDVRKSPIQAITPTGVRTADADYPLDAIVFATGFDAMTGALLAMDIRGRGGVRLKEVWEDGPRAYLGLAVAGFPNLFMVTGPGSPSVLSNMLNSIEQHGDWIADCIGYLRANNLTRIDADPEAQERWVERVAEVADHTLFPRANSWYVGANIEGKPRVFMPYIGPDYRQRCEAVAAAGYEGFEVR